MLTRLQSKGGAVLAQALGFQEDGWSCGYYMLHLCHEVASQRGSLDDVVVTPSPKVFIKEAPCSFRVPGTIPKNGWEGEVACWKRAQSPPALASNPESPPLSTSPHFFYEEGPLSELEGNIATSSSEPTFGEFPACPVSNSEDVPQDGKLMKGNGQAPPQTMQFKSSSPPPPTTQIMMPFHTCSSVGSFSRCLRDMYITMNAFSHLWLVS